jgi:hypothetical protein
MSAARAVTVIVALLIPAALWGYLNNARNDVRTFTRSLIRQVQAVEKEDRAADLDAPSRVDAAQARLFIRFRHPDGDPDEQSMMFAGLWSSLLRGDPETAEYTKNERPIRIDGKEHRRRQVRFRSRGRDGDRTTVVVNWVHQRGGWYIYGYTVNGGAPATLF